jgi:hypothetical protein
MGEKVVGCLPQLVGDVRGLRQGTGAGDEGEVGEADLELHGVAP